MKFLIPAVAVVIAQVAAPAVLACGAHQSTTTAAAALSAETTVVASNTDKVKD